MAKTVPKQKRLPLRNEQKINIHDQQDLFTHTQFVHNFTKIVLYKNFYIFSHTNPHPTLNIFIHSLGWMDDRNFKLTINSIKCLNFILRAPLQCVRSSVFTIAVCCSIVYNRVGFDFKYLKNTTLNEI